MSASAIGSGGFAFFSFNFGVKYQQSGIERNIENRREWHIGSVWRLSLWRRKLKSSRNNEENGGHRGNENKRRRHVAYQYQRKKLGIAKAW